MSKMKIAGKPRHMWGWVRDLPDHRDFLFAAAPRTVRTLPKQVDLRSLCSRVEDQSNLGSCTANSSTSAMEFLYNKAKKPVIEFSRLFVYFASRVWVEKVAPTEDPGCMIRNVMKALAMYGACPEDKWPYNIGAFSTTPNAAAKKAALDHQITRYYRTPNLKNVRSCLAEGYPAVGGFAVPESIDDEATVKTGVVKYPKPTEGFVGGHAVLFVGYDDKTKLLTFQNSWGANWGNKGFGYLPYAYVENLLADDFWTIRQEEM